MNHNRKFDKNAIKTKYLAVMLLIFFGLSIFSFQATLTVNSENPWLSQSEMYVSPNFSEIAFLSYSSNQPDHLYLMVKNISTETINSYPVNSSFLGHSVSISFYNQSSFLFSNNQGTYLYNTATKLLKAFLIASIYYINSTLLFGSLYRDPNNSNKSQLSLHNPVNSHNITIEINKTFNYNPTFLKFTINSALSKLVIVNGDQMYFYNLKNFNAQLLNISKISLINTAYQSNFHFLPWNSPSVVYYSNYNTTYTQMDSFNFSSKKENVIAKIDKGLNINSINVKLQDFTTQFPSPSQLYSIDNSNIHLLLTFNSSFVYWDNIFDKVVEVDGNAILLFTFDHQTQKLSNEQVLFSSLTANDTFLLNSLKNLNFFCTVALFVAIIIVSKKEKVWG